MTKIFGALTAVALLCTPGCTQRRSPLVRYIDADYELAIAYASSIPGVAEAALHKHRAFLIKEMSHYGTSNYQIAYAYATERLARECEKRGAAENAHALRVELAAFVNSIDSVERGPITTDNVARAVSQIDWAIRKPAAQPCRE